MKIEVNELACGYKEPILEHLRFTVEDHRICCILGPNGVGKTTLFHTFLGFLPPMGGSILLDGRDVTRWSPKEMAKTVAYMAQSHVPPFPYKVEDVVLLGRVATTGYFRKPKKQDVDIAREAMEAMGVYALREKPYTEISGGERQLVMLARAITQEPRLLVLDEPTASLDYGNQARVLEKVLELRDRGYGILMTTHAPEQAFLCDADVVLLRRNAPMEFGPAREVVTEKNLREAYGVPVRVVEHLGADGRTMRFCSPVISE